MVDFTPLLLADTSANLRYLVLTELLYCRETDTEVISTKALRKEDIIVKELFNQQNADGSWTPGIIYNSNNRSVFQTTCDIMRRLGYLGFDSSDHIVAKAAEYIFSQQNPDGSWTNSLRTLDGVPPTEINYLPLHTALPLRALVSCGYAEDKRSLKAFDLLLERQLPDGAWPTGKAGGGVNMYRAGYRKLPLSRFGCRSNTTGVLSCLAYHPKLKHSEEARKGMEHLLSCQTYDRQTLGFEVARIVGFEGTSGTLTYYAKLDQLLTLDLSWRMGVSRDDKRLDNIVKFVTKSVTKFGLLLYKPNQVASRWISFDMLRSLRKLKIEDDWFPQNLEVPFQRYPKIKKRY